MRGRYDVACGGEIVEELLETEDVSNDNDNAVFRISMQMRVRINGCILCVSLKVSLHELVT